MVMLSRYIHEAMRRARYKTLPDGTTFGRIPGISGVWANETTPERCQEVLQDVLEEWLILKIREHDAFPRMGRISLPMKAA